MSKVGHWISDNRDQINLFMIKILGTILTALAIIGYLLSLSKFDHLLNIHIMVVAFLLLMVTLTGHSVYVYKMMTDIAGDATLLNHVYMILAISSQIITSLIFCRVVFETMFPKEDNFYKIFAMECTIFIRILNVWTVTSIACTTLLKNRSPESYMNLSQKSPKVVMIIFGINLLCTITVFFSGFQIRKFEEKKEHYEKIMYPLFLASFCILIKVNEDEYGIAKRVMKKLGKMLRRSNSVRPEIDGGEGMVENRTVYVNVEDTSQAQVIENNFKYLLKFVFRLGRIKVP